MLSQIDSDEAAARYSMRCGCAEQGRAGRLLDRSQRVCNLGSPGIDDYREASWRAAFRAYHASMTREEINIEAFLRLIRFAEHQSDRDDVYFTLYGGRQRFTDTSRHPNKAITAWGRTSTPAGAYQILYGTWKEAKDRGVVVDFSKRSQDKLARAKLQSRGALSYIQMGQFEHAVPLLRKEWTSLPGAAQSRMTMAQGRELFDKYVAELAK